MGKRSLGLAMALVALGLARTSAADVTRADHDRAVAEFNAGRTFFEAGDCKGAIPHFVASLKLEQNVGARFNLAECSAREGRIAVAWNHYKAAEQLAIKKNDTQRIELAHAAAADLDRRVTRIHLVIPSDIPVTPKIDGVAVDPTDYAQLQTSYAIEPDVDHVLSAESSGKPTWTRRGVRGAAGIELPAMVVDFGPPPGTIIAPQPSPLRTPAYVVGGVGAAALVAGGVFGLLASSAKSDAKSSCETPGFSYPASCNPLQRSSVDSANSRAQTDATISTVAVIGGAALVATAAVLFYVSRPKAAPTTAGNELWRLLATGTF